MSLLLVTVDLWVLQVALLITCGLVVGLTVALVALTARRAHQRTARRALRERWLATLAPAFEPDRQQLVPSRALESLSEREQVATVTTVLSQLSAETFGQVRRASGAADLVAAGRRWLTSRRWWRRLQGVRTLVLLGEPVPEAVRLLDDPHPDVRAEAAALVTIGPVGDEALHRLVQMLGDPVLRCRFAAEEALLAIGAPVTDALVAALGAEESAATPAMLRIASRIASPPLLSPALTLDHADDPATRAGAADVLGTIGGDRAATALRELLNDPQAMVRAAAARSLGSLGEWASAPLLAARVKDPSWDVRRAAAGALRSLGPAGRMYLRRSAGSADPAEAQMAQHVLDLPEIAVNLRAS